MEGEDGGDTGHWWAFVDEAIWVPPAGAGCYILAAAMVECSAFEAVRTSVVELLLPRQRRLHWRDESPPRRSKIVAGMAGLDVLHLAVVGTPVDPSRQERARRKCLEHLLYLLAQSRVDQAVLESRTRVLDARDLAVVEALRGRRVVPTSLRVSLRKPIGEPLLWLADAVAGSLRAGIADGTHDYIDALRAVIDQHDISV